MNIREYEIHAQYENQEEYKHCTIITDHKSIRYLAGSLFHFGVSTNAALPLKVTIKAGQRIIETLDRSTIP